MRIEDLLHRLDQGNCPSPSRVALELTELLQRDDAGVAAAAAIVSRDPILAAKSLKLANSVLYRGLRPTVAIDDAIMRIGLQTLARLSLSLSLIEQHTELGAKLDLPYYWSAALARAIAMQSLARQLGGWSPTEMFTLGLLADIGRLILACTTPEDYANLQEKAIDCSELLELERECFGFDHRQLSSILLRRWSLPEIMACAVYADPAVAPAENGARSATLRAMLELSGRIGESVENLRDDTVLPTLKRYSRHMELDDDGLNAVLGDVETQWQELAGLFEIDQPPDIHDRLMRLRQPISQDAAQAGHAQSARVLLVDDETGSHALVTRLLEPAGYQVLHASSAEEAMALIQQSLPRILIIDWVMPGMDGLQLCKNLRRQFGGRLYVLMFSAHIDSTRTIDALEAGANDFLEKPISRKLLLAKLHTARHTVELTLALEEEHRHNERTHRELVRLNDALRQAAMHDELTTLPNRRAFDTCLREAWEPARRYDLPLSCIMLDIDHFKRVNDDYGHDSGDRALQALANLLHTHTRSGDRAARYGGEEFIILCTNNDIDGARQLAERIRHEVEALRGDYPQITVSGGVAQMTADMQDPADLVYAADQCLFEAKRSGRNCIVARQSSAQEDGT